MTSVMSTSPGRGLWGTLTAIAFGLSTWEEERRRKGGGREDEGRGEEGISSYIQYCKVMHGNYLLKLK